MAGLSTTKRRATFPTTTRPSQDSFIISQPQPQPTASRLQLLPPELKKEICSYLSYVEAVRVTSVNKHFYDFIDPSSWPEEDKKADLHMTEKWERYNKAYLDFRFSRYKPRSVVTLNDGYACFHCYKIHEKSQFSRNMTERDGAKGSGTYTYVGHFRCCIDCAIKEGKYRPGMFFKVVTSQSLNLHGGYVSKSKTSKCMVVCPACNEAHEYVEVGDPDICNGCEKDQIEYDDSPEALKALKGRKKGHHRFQCLGCLGVSTMKKARFDYMCHGCDDLICKKCGGAKAEGCSCGEPVESFTAMKRLFQTGGREEDYVADVFAEDDAEVLGLLALE